MIDNKKTAIEKIIENYDKKHSLLKNKIEALNDELNKISTSSYSTGIPDTKFNRGDEGNDFDFPIKWGITCKKMEKSIYLEPVLTFFKNIFNTFNYSIEIPDEYDNNITVKTAYDFFVKQFKRVGGLQNLLVEIAYNTLVYGFNFFTPKLEVMNGNIYGLKGNYECLKGFKFYDPTLLYSFIFNEDDTDELQAVKIFSSPKQLGGKSDAEGLLYNDYLGNLLKQTTQKLITIDFDLSVAGYCHYGTIQGDPLGKPFLYSVYPLWKVLENMDNSFNRNLSNIGEHSFNYSLYNTAEGLSDEQRKVAEKEIRDFVNRRGGVFIGSFGKIEKIEGIDANEWYNFRDGMLSTIFKNKGVDIKSLGLNRGATRDLASISQSDSIINAYGIISRFVEQINNTFMKRYFDLNFKDLRIQGLCDYFRIKCEVPAENIEAIGKEENNQNLNNDSLQLSNLSGINKDNKDIIQTNTTLSDGSKQVVDYDNGKPISSKTTIPMSKFIKQLPDDITQFVIDTTDLERILVRSSEELNRYLLDFIKNAMIDDTLIEKALKNPTSFIRGSLLNKNQRLALTENIKKYLENHAYEFFNYKAKEIVNGAGGIAFTDIFGKSLESWIDTQVKYFLKNKITLITDDLSAKVEKIAIDNLFNMSRGYTKDIDIKQAKDFIKDKIFNLKGKQLNSIVDNEVITVFQNVSDIANETASQKIEDMAVIRTGVLEKMCSHCQKYFGVLYKKDSEGNYYNIDHEYIKLPDKDCLGGAENCKCYYVPVAENTLNIINNLLTNRSE